MRVCQFNFNNEVDTFEIHIEDDGSVAVPGENGETLATYDNVEQLAEIYAQARDVKPENLKNWVLLENGNVFSFVLRAGTAGVNVGEVEEQLEAAFASLGDRYHPLNVARAKEQIMQDGALDLTEVLVHCTETDIARDIYDAMSGVINGAPAEETPVEEEDNRSDLEKYLDTIAEIPGAMNFIAMLAGIGAGSDKDEILEALNGNIALSNVNTLKAAYDNAVDSVINNGIGVQNTADALTVITQIPVGTKDDAMKQRMVATTHMAGRDKVNISVDIVGRNHIRHTAEMVDLTELDNVDLLVRDNVPYIVRFDELVDEELEAERNAAAEAEDDSDRTYDNDEYDDEDGDDEY